MAHQDRKVIGLFGSKGRNGKPLYVVGLAVSQLCSLLRYITLARILGPSELGLAAILIAIGAFFDMMTDVGVDRFLIQDKYGDDPAVQRSAQRVLLFRAVGTIVMLCLAAPFVADFYGQPVLLSGVIGMAGVPLFMAFFHLDIKRRQRNHDFSGEGIMLFSSESASLLVTIAAAFILRSHVAVLVGLSARAFVMTLVSHILAERKYSARYDTEHGRRILAFALPLTLNGLCLFIASQSDRLTIGKVLGIKELGIYSALLLLIFYPSAIIAKYLQNIAMPILASKRDVATALDESARSVLGLGILYATAMMIGYICVTPIVAPILFGSRFVLPVSAIALIGALQCVRFLQFYPSVLAMAHGRTKLILLSNFLRAFPLVAAVIAAALGQRLTGVLIALTAGEAIALVAGLAIVNTKIGRSGKYDIVGIARYLALTVAVIVTVFEFSSGSPAIGSAAALITMVLVGSVFLGQRDQLAAGVAWLRHRVTRRTSPT